ncbi:MAG: dual specificity protein phosphatase family protein [Planctomycetes bacterium]|nr:dual specificity protein phosphatase family protein [Planctomycetota bacterium]
MAVNFSYVIPGKLAGMEFPGSFSSIQEDLDFLDSEKIGAVVSLTAENLDQDELAMHNFETLHLPIRDFSAPSLEQIETFVSFVDQQIAQGKAVVVHCGVGKGRTGTMLACYLVSTGLDAKKAIARVRKLRPRSIETSQQEKIVHSYARQRGRKS